MRNIIIFCLISLFLAEANAAAYQAFSIYDNQVTFDVPADWVVIQKDSNANVDVVVFQVKNPADEGTPDSTNVAVLVYKDKKVTVEDIAASSMNRIKGYPGGCGT
jgi:hypothetical protein